MGAIGRTDARRICLGFCLSCFCGCVGLLARYLANTQWVYGFIGLFIIPFLIAIIATRDPSVSLGITWINELFYGVDGRWIEIGPLQGRGALLIGFLFFSYLVYLLRIVQNKSRSKSSYVDWAVLFYGLFIPGWLIFYSAVRGDVPIGAAIGDATRYFVLLTYFPLRKLINKDDSIVLGWICGGSVMLSAMMLFSAIGPQPFASMVYLAYSGVDNIATLSSGISRTATPILVLTLIGVYLGMLYIVDNSQPIFARIVGILLMCISLSPLVISFMRGPLLSMFAICSLLFSAYMVNKRLRAKALRLGLSIITVAILSFITMLTFVPEGLERFNLSGRTVHEFLTDDPDRQEQAKRMLEAFAESPVFGKGVGAPLSGYQRGANSDTLSFELHYHMLLYRTGALVFALFCLAIVWFFFEPFRLCRNRSAFVLERKGKLAMAMLLALLTTFIAGSSNPYLVTAFTLFLISFYLAARQERFVR